MGNSTAYLARTAAFQSRADRFPPLNNFADHMRSRRGFVQWLQLQFTAAATFSWTPPLVASSMGYSDCYKRQNSLAVDHAFQVVLLFFPSPLAALLVCNTYIPHGQ